MENKKKVKVIITGATGMVGEGVLHECLLHNDVDEVLVIGRKSCGMNHPKIKEIIINNFFDLSTLKNKISAYNACFFCLGTTSVNKDKSEYYNMTYTLTLHFAETLVNENSHITFCYVSGAGTDSTEKGKIAWARVKGKTENDLIKLPFKHVFCFRPAIIKPTKGLKNTLEFYKYIIWLYPFGKALLPKYFCTLKEIGLAMINSVNHKYEKNILEVKDIISLSQK